MTKQEKPTETMQTSPKSNKPTNPKQYIQQNTQYAHYLPKNQLLLSLQLNIPIYVHCVDRSDDLVENFTYQHIYTCVLRCVGCKTQRKKHQNKQWIRIKTRKLVNFDRRTQLKVLNLQIARSRVIILI